MYGRVFEMFSKNQNFFQNFIIAQNRSQKCPNVFWTCFEVIFPKSFFAQCSMEGRVFEMFSKNQKNFKFPKMPKIVPKNRPNVFWTCFRGNFFEKIFCPMFHGVSSLRNVFVKKLKIFQISKNAQDRSQIVQTCFEQVLGEFFRKKFLPSVPWMVESSKCFQKIKNFSKFHNCTKSFPKVSKRVLNMFWGNFSEKFFCPVFHGVSSLRNVFKKWKIFQTSIIAQNRSQKCANVFWTSVGLTFSNNFFAQCSMEGRVFEMLLKKLKKFKIPKTPKIVPKMSKSVLNMFLGTFFEKFFLPSVPCRVESSKRFRKIKNFQNSKKPKIVPKSVQTCFEHVLR